MTTHTGAAKPSHQAFFTHDSMVAEAYRMDIRRRKALFAILWKRSKP